MALLKLLLFWLAIIAEGKAYEVVNWPERYTLKATKYSPTDNLIEDYEIWRSENNSRIDYNHGAVKSIVLSFVDEFPSGVTYNIHPEAFVNQTVQTVCYYNATSDISPETILPSVDDLINTGSEIMYDKNATKFEYDIIDYDIRTIKHIWATYDYTEYVWIPIRYDLLKYDTELGNKMEHEIWEFNGFSTTFTDDVFEVNYYYECGNRTEEIDMNSDQVTKELAFIDPDNEDHVDHVFNVFKKTHARNYVNKREHAKRRNIFKDNMRLIASTNRKGLGYKLTVNQFTDRSPDEMNRYTGSRQRADDEIGTIPFPYTGHKLAKMSKDLPKEFDLRLLGVVSEVKNQGDCNSDWSFAAAAVAEGALALSNGNKLVSLSNQALIDCAWGFGASGCEGSTDHAAYKWMMENGLPTVAEYGPYVTKEGICHIKNVTKTYQIWGYTDVTPLSEEALKIALINHGPVSVSVHASDSFKSYSSGIFYDFDCKQDVSNHQMALVGYGERYGETFWILKNSWGPNWGIDGFMYISAKDNVCGVATKPSYVVF